MGIVGGRVYIFNLLNCEMQKDTLIPDGKKFMINEVASGNKILLSLAGRFIQNGVPSIVEGVRNITRLIFEPVPLTKKLCKLETMDLLNSICDELDSDRGILLFIDAIFSHDANSDSIKRHIAPLDKDHGKDKVLLMGEVVKQTARDAISEKKVKKSLKKMMSRKLTSLIEYEDSPPLATLIPIISRSFDDLFTPELVSEFSCLKALSASMFVSQTLQS